MSSLLVSAFTTTAVLMFASCAVFTTREDFTE